MQVSLSTAEQEASSEASSFGARPARKPRENLDLPTALLLGTALFAAWFSWVTPNHYQPWLTFHSELSMAVAGVCYGTWVLWRCRGKLGRLPAVAALGILAAIVPFAQLAVRVLPFAGDAWLASMYLLGFGLTAWFGYLAADRFGLLKSLRPLQAVILAGALLSMWLALYQWLGLHYFQFMAIDIDIGMRPYANVIQPNQLATLLVLGVLAVAFLYEAGTIGPFGSSMCILFFAFGVAMTQSRSGLLELAVVAVVLLLRGPRALTGRLTRAPVAILGGLSLLMPLLWEPLRRMSDRSSVRDTVEMVSAGTRPIHWSSMLDAAFRHPWFGYGWSQVGEAQYLVAPDHPVSHETIAHSHSLVLDLLVENGVVLGSFFILALLAWFVLGFRRARDPLTLLALCSVIAVFVHALLEFPLSYTYFLLPVGVLMGAVSFQAGVGFVTQVPRWLAPLLLTAVAVMTVAVTREYFQLESDVRDIRFEHAHIARATPYKPSPLRVLTQLGHYWNFAYSPERRDLTPAELEDMRLTMLRFPSKENMVRYAVFLALNGQGDKAPEVLRRLCFMNPETACKQFQRFWELRGERDPEVKAIPWPAPR